MDNDRRPRQNPSGYASQQGALLQPQSSYPVVSASDRFRQAPPTSAPASGSRAGSQSYGYAYGEGSQFVGSSIQPSGVSYSAQDYASDSAQAQPQRASQSYPQYGQNVMYNVPGAQASATASSQYEPVQQYQQNRDSAIEVLTTNFGVAQPQYYPVPAGEGGPTSAPASAIAAQNVPSQYSSLGYTAQQAPVPRESLAPAYSAAGMTDPHQPTSHGAYPQGSAYADQQHASGNEYDEFYNNYQNELKKTFEHTRDGRLGEAGQQLFRLSDWLLHWAETLGLVRDDETHYQQRLTLWEQFNNCWLTTLQRQKQMTQEMINTGQRPQPPQTLIDYDFLEKMGNQLVKNCDNMEKHGLVDYQMGVWEEEIVAMLTSCLDLLEEVGAGSSAQRPTASASRRR
ncbi:hypothetical protein BS50DRAFT_26305 [Corynespora cassiicola Philippines]|uniref:Uncharacterized protein n=1 Tax=Corynespora cassiicola Philippines TaxID=1448308 RepID=A0A2T2PBZ2_CORCC|nr:hypothetical protein BS50DRAFT_26305 [Corynespora cassiicola Philippines]